MIRFILLLIALSTQLAARSYFELHGKGPEKTIATVVVSAVESLQLKGNTITVVTHSQRFTFTLAPDPLAEDLDPTSVGYSALRMIISGSPEEDEARAKAKEWISITRDKDQQVGVREFYLSQIQAHVGMFTCTSLKVE